MFTVLQYFRMLVLKPVATGLILPYLRLKFEEQDFSLTFTVLLYLRFSWGEEERRVMTFEGSILVAIGILGIAGAVPVVSVAEDEVWNLLSSHEKAAAMATRGAGSSTTRSTRSEPTTWTADSDLVSHEVEAEAGFDPDGFPRGSPLLADEVSDNRLFWFWVFYKC